MKIFKYILLLAAFVAVSCGDDDYSVEYIDTEVKTSVTGTISPSRTKIAPTTQLEFTVTLDQTFTYDAEITVAITETCNSLGLLATDSSAVATLTAGSDTATGVITVPDLSNEDTVGGWVGLSNCTALTVTGIALYEVLADDSTSYDVDDPYVIENISTPLNLTDLQGSWMEAQEDAGSLQICLDWEGPYSSNDIDLFVYDAALTAAYERSESGSRWEGDWFNNSGNEAHPDGDYVVYVSPYTMATASTDAALHFTHPDGTVDYIEFAITGNMFAADITLSTDADGVKSYVVTPR